MDKSSQSSGFKLVLLAIFSTCVLAGGHARAQDDVSALRVARQGYFFVNGTYFTASDGTPFLANQSYVEYQIPEEQEHPYPIVFFPGGGQTGTNFMGTPDDRAGWAQFFVSHGYAVYIVDEAARGKAPWSVDLDGPIPAAGRYASVEQMFTAIQLFNRWPQAHLHTQWPGTGLHGDPIFDQFLASQVSSNPNFVQQELLERAAGAEILDKIGPALILTHSLSGPYGWVIADARPTLVKGVLAIEPNGPPLHDIVDIGPPTYFTDGAASRPWGITRTPITYAPPVTDPSQLSFVQDATSEGPDLVRCWRQTAPAHQLPTLKGIPILIVTSEAGYHAPYDDCTSEYLTVAGVPNTHVHLGEVGIHGNGHMMMIEKNNLEIAALINSWIKENVEKRGD
jgi:pimeloyl-ACP methyl ester carboxylesterase